MIDLARHLVGEIREVSAALTTFIDERPLPDGRGVGRVDVDDAAAALLRFEGGMVGTLEVSRFATGHRNSNRFEVSGSAGSLAFDLERLNELAFFDRSDGDLRGFRNVLVTERDHPYIAAYWPPGHTLGWEHTFIHTVHDLIQAIAAGGTPTPNFEDGLRAQQVIAAIERAGVSRRWEPVDTSSI
jgi:predicted dehydrogenase